ncbi:MAG: DUF1697 domain-containing protein [Pseudonocardiaceae bacterium]|nr:DUF1697 domain-containing protein [Pseudonocardiaceae bacterium]
MTSYVALLRGVNVGGRQQVPMAELRAMLGSLGHTDVTTYLNSGNAVFSNARDDVDGLAREIEERIERDLGIGVTVILRTGSQLAAAIDANPYPAATADPKTLHVGFMSAAPDPERLSGIDQGGFGPDESTLGDGVVYLHYPNGAGRSKLTTDVLERRLGVRITARNWNTVTKLLDLLSD